MPLGRIAAVTASLALVGAVIGGVVGGALVAVRELFSESDLVGLEVYGALAGAALGAILAPATAWLFLRRVALGRAIAETTIGTTAGAALGMAIETFVLKRPTAQFGLIGALVGFFAAAVRLRIITRSSAVDTKASAHGA